MVWSYEQALAWLYGRQALGIKLGLDKVRDLLAVVGDPQNSFRSIHVAGTNGKGTVTWMLDAALQEAGHRVGRFTSPHLVRFTERVTVNGLDIPTAAVAEHLATLKAAIEPLDERGEPPTFFEITTALAFLHFRDEGVDWAVIETGMGGRLDATNVVAPELTVITNVALDHTQFLGATLEEIAAEKAGIMKAGVPCITGASGPARKVLIQVSQGLQVPMSIVGDDYLVEPTRAGMRLVHPGGEAQYQVAAPGPYQRENAALVVAAADALRQAGVDLPVASVQRALASIQIPARAETLNYRDTPVLVDGAHNIGGAHALRLHLASADFSQFHLIVGFAADKDWASLLETWSPLAIHVWGVPLRSGRSLDPAITQAELSAYVPFDVALDARGALDGAVDAGAQRILVTGSLFLAGEARAVILGEPLEEIRGNQ